MTIMKCIFFKKVVRNCVGKIAEFVKGTLLIAEAIRQEFKLRLDH